MVIFSFEKGCAAVEETLLFFFSFRFSSCCLENALSYDRYLRKRGAPSAVYSVFAHPTNTHLVINVFGPSLFRNFILVATVLTSRYNLVSLVFKKEFCSSMLHIDD